MSLNVINLAPSELIVSSLHLQIMGLGSGGMDMLRVVLSILMNVVDIERP